MKIIVLAKQVPDTRNVGKDAMKEDGTINRAVLPPSSIRKTSMRWSKHYVSKNNIRVQP